MQGRQERKRQEREFELAKRSPRPQSISPACGSSWPMSGGYSSDDPASVSVDETTGTLTLLANARAQIRLSLTTCLASVTERTLWANLLPAPYDVDLATSSSGDL